MTSPTRLRSGIFSITTWARRGFWEAGSTRPQDLAQKVAAAGSGRGPASDWRVLTEKSKEYDAAEQHLRRAIQLAPKQARRVMDLARFLAKRGRAKESDALFDQAQRMAPENPQHSVLLAPRAYIEGNRNLSDARALLQTLSARASDSRRSSAAAGPGSARQDAALKETR